MFSFTLGLTLKLRVNSLGSVYFFGYWIFDLEMRKTKQSVFSFSIFVPIIENRK